MYSSFRLVGEFGWSMAIGPYTSDGHNGLCCCLSMPFSVAVAVFSLAMSFTLPAAAAGNDGVTDRVDSRDFSRLPGQAPKSVLRLTGSHSAARSSLPWRISR